MPTPLSPKGSTCYRLSVALALVVLATRVSADLVLDLGDVTGAHWSAGAVRLQVEYPHDSEIDLSLAADYVQLPGGNARLKHFSLACTRTQLGATDWRCDRGVIQFELQGDLLATNFQLTRTGNTYRFELPGVELEGLSLRVHAEHTNGSWLMGLRALSTDLGALAQLIPTAPLVGVELFAGAATLELDLEGDQSSLDGSGTLELEDLAFSDASGLRAGEGIAVVIQASFSRQAPEWSFDSRLRLDRGELVVDNFYLLAHGPPRRVHAAGVWDEASDRLRLEQFEVDHPGVLALSGSLDVGLGTPPILNGFSVQMPRSSLSLLYHHYLKSLALGGALESIEVDGELGLDIQWGQPGGNLAHISMHQINVEDESDNFAVYGLNGELNWSATGISAPTRLRWSGGSVYTLTVGGGGLRGKFHPEGFRLSRPISIPVLDGELNVEDFELEGLGGSPVWRMSGGLTPVSMETLCHALGWPSFSGTLAGSVPGVRYEDGEITTNGAMVMRVFDGEVLIRDLRLTRAFDVVPELRANVDMWRLDLEQLTRAFSFGNIEGKLDGRIHGLVLQDWKPVAFDAAFATPEKDKSRHRISQNAVDSLARVGGGGGALSATFLSFLEEFSYDRLGLSCRLRNGVCAMGGVEAAERGYYIVKGGGFPPRIDVLGFNDRVAWKVLVERLQNIANSQAPIIQ